MAFDFLDRLLHKPCTLCGQPSPLLSRVHDHCRQAFVKAERTVTGLVSSAVRGPGPVPTGFHDVVRRAAEAGRMPAHDIRGAVTAGLGAAVDTILADAVLTAEEESRVTATRTELGAWFDTGSDAYLRVIKGGVLRDLAEGVLPQRLTFQGDLPFNLQRGESLVWVFTDVGIYGQVTRRHYEGGSHGISIRIVKGLYYRTGAFKGHPVSTTSMESLGSGLLGISNKHLHFVGDGKTLRIRHRDIIAVEAYSDGVGIARDRVRDARFTFVTGDGWFTYNLLANIQQVG